MSECPDCQDTHEQIKAGFNRSGSQRCRCMVCKRRYTPQPARHYSDLLASYKKSVYYPGKHTPMPNKSETYRVEEVNAELRHYLARLHRRSRCISRCVDALRRNVKLFVYAWNRRQLHLQQYPKYKTFPMQFISP